MMNSRNGTTTLVLLAPGLAYATRGGEGGRFVVRSSSPDYNTALLPLFTTIGLRQSFPYRISELQGKRSSKNRKVEFIQTRRLSRLACEQHELSNSCARNANRIVTRTHT